MDAEELPETVAPRTGGSAEHCGLNEAAAACRPAAGAACRPGCALELVSELLSLPGAVSGDQADQLLDLHQLLRSRSQAEDALRLFCDLRRRLEQRHYLLLYRLRKWLEHHVVAEIRPRRGDVRITLPVRLNFYCVEAVRRSCLCAALEQGVAVQTPRLGFQFVPLPR